MNEKQNPWLDEGSRYDESKPKQTIRDMKFSDNSTHTVRILPSKNPDDFPFHGYKMHWIPQNGSNVGKPVIHGIDERCPICDWLSTQWDEVHRLKEEEDMTDKSPEVKELLSKISPVSAKTRYDMNVIHREDLYVVNEETGEKTMASKRMGVGSTVYKEIFGFAKKWGSPSNEESGYDLEISTSGSKERREYRTIPDRDASPLTLEEKKLIETCYDLKELRKKTTLDEIIKILGNARTPYHEILNYCPNTSSSARQEVKKDDVVQVEEEIKEAISTEKNTEGKVEKKIVEKEERKEVVEEQVVEESVEQAEESTDDENNIEVYECKGDFDSNDEMCSDCPVKKDCEDVKPFYVKAKQLKIDIDPHRKTTEIIDEVKKAEEKTDAPSTAKGRGKKIPF